jgi:single-stranded DNA-binding protein
MSASINRVFLYGSVSQYGFRLKQTPTGSSYAAGSLTVIEQGANGKAFSTFVPVEVWGKGASAAADVAPGTLCMVEGKIARKKGRDDRWEVVVSTFGIAPVATSPRRQATAGQSAMDDEDLPF